MSNSRADPKPARTFGVHPVDVDLNPFRNDVVQQRSLMTRMVLSGLLYTETASFLHFTKTSHRALSWAARGPIRLNKRPVVMRLTIFIDAYSSQEHAGIGISSRSSSVGLKRIEVDCITKWQEN
ncbi:MAG: hypothetical protein ONB46_02725 [candidate division KSB1 bacterium]|nr:hypothetical protein [candidate division KSB1 bacterium]MDZ7364850.1 hypothetical protein [candidate division KSB1 bacterium]MDZ7402953.1 hypothetical protein [candidate division KSB1 bacterium]